MVYVVLCPTRTKNLKWYLESTFQRQQYILVQYTMVGWGEIDYKIF